MIPHYKKECRSIDLIDETSPAEFNEVDKCISTKTENFITNSWEFQGNGQQEIEISDVFQKICNKYTRKPDKVKYGKLEVEIYIANNQHFFKI